MQYLLKSEPDQYSLSDLEHEGHTVWDGVANPVAVRHLSEMKVGDKLVYYHTGDERQAVGTAVVSSVDVTDRKNPRVEIKYSHRFSQPHKLAEIKSERIFADSPLVKQGRLSVVPLTDEQYSWLTSG